MSLNIYIGIIFGDFFEFLIFLDKLISYYSFDNCLVYLGELKSIILFKRRYHDILILLKHIFILPFYNFIYYIYILFFSCEKSEVFIFNLLQNIFN
jgi:hypothetical protein